MASLALNLSPGNRTHLLSPEHTTRAHACNVCSQGSLLLLQVFSRMSPFREAFPRHLNSNCSPSPFYSSYGRKALGILLFSLLLYASYLNESVFNATWFVHKQADTSRCSHLLERAVANAAGAHKSCSRAPWSTLQTQTTFTSSGPFSACRVL